MQVAHNVFMLDVQRDKSALHPCLILGGEAAVLVDACLPNQFAALKSAIEETGTPLSSITHLIITHHDMDHIGCIGELRAALPKLQLLAHQDEIPFMDGSQTPAKLAKRLASAPQEEQAFIQEMLAGYKARATQFDQALQGGQHLPLCGGIEIIHTPGHTPGHICLYLPAAKLLITGDAMNLSGNELTGPNPIHTLDMPLATQSLLPLQGLEISQVVCYHGGLFTGDFQAALSGILQAGT